MVSRIEVIPSEVRGYGNIVGAKSVEDFVPVGSELSFSENVYSLTALEGLRITLTASQSSISYGSSVSLSATVVEDDEPVTGVSVTFYDGSTSLGTATTNSNGVATYTTSSLTVGSHSCTAVYDEKTSNSVSVTVNKLASTISLTVPASGTVGTAYTVTGTLVPSSGSVKLYENGSLKDTLTVSSGSFSKSITQSNEGTYSYYAVFEGSSTYEGSTSSIQSITVEAIPVPSYNGVSLSSNKSILSKYNSESATLTAQLLDGSSSASVSGVTVEFFKGSTSLGTATTNSSGVATKSYSSTGAGDVSLTASAGTFVSETYVIEDCYFYDDCSTNKLSKYTTNLQSTSTATYTADGLLITGVGSHNYNQLQAPVTGVNGDVEFTVDVKGDWSNSHNHGIWIADRLITSSDNYNSINGYGLEIYGSNKGVIKYTNGSTSNISRTSPVLNNRTWYTFKFSLKNGTLTSTILDGSSSVFSNSTSYPYSFGILFLMTIWSDMKGYFKNIKVKAL